ncbi:10797_t:CDS:2 [Rhizophagus irregularis]|nr:10797_t:CDS:2 [Rhizophagus irregularis]
MENDSVGLPYVYNITTAKGYNNRYLRQPTLEDDLAVCGFCNAIGRAAGAKCKNL